MSRRPEFFSHVLEEEQWRQANRPELASDVHSRSKFSDASLEECPECYAPMTKKGNEEFCHSCGHRQPIIYASQKSAGGLLAVPELLGGLGGDVAGGLGGMSELPFMGGGGFGGGAIPGLGEISNLMNGAMNPGQGQAQQSPSEMSSEPMALPGAVAKTGGMFGEEEVGTATKNRGENSTEDASEGGIAGKKEQGDGPEQLKDVGGGPKNHDSQSPEGGMHDPAAQEKAMKAFDVNKPLVMEFFHSDEDGSSNPILQALDQMLEQAFPGYRGSPHGEQVHDEVSETPEERDADADSDESSEDSDKERKDKKVAESAVNALWEVLSFGELGPVGAPAAAPGVIPGQQGTNCPRCGQAHDPSAPCPAAMNQQMGPSPQVGAAPYAVGMNPVTPPIPQKVVTYKTAVTAWPKEAEFGDGHTGDSLIDDGYYDEPMENPECPMCGGPGVPLGSLGRRQHFRCRNCGMDFSNEDQGIDQLGPEIHGPEAPLPPATAVRRHDPEPWEKYVEDKEDDDYGDYDDDDDDNKRESSQSVAPVPDPHQKEDEDEEEEDEDRHDVKTKQEEIEEHFSAQNSLTYKDAGEGNSVYGPTHDGQEIDHFQKHHGEQEWTDEDGQPLQPGGQYELKSSHYAVPDRITIVKVAPGHVVYTTHSGDIDYKHELTKLDQQVNDYVFARADDGQEDSLTDPGSVDVPPVRPGQDPTPQVDDLSTPSTTVSHFDPYDANTYTGSFHGDNPGDRSWLNEGGLSQPVEVDPALMAKLAGKDFSPREQREFIDESGPARNLDKLDLAGTHYNEIADNDPELALW